MNDVGTRAMFIDLVKVTASVDRSAATIARDDRCRSLHEKIDVGASLWFGDVAVTVTVKIDKSRSHNESRGIDDPS